MYINLAKKEKEKKDWLREGGSCRLWRFNAKFQCWSINKAGFAVGLNLTQGSLSSPLVFNMYVIRGVLKFAGMSD